MSASAAWGRLRSSSRFRACLEQLPDDFLCRHYAEACAAFIVQPPPDDWDATVAMKEK